MKRGWKQGGLIICLIGMGLAIGNRFVARPVRDTGESNLVHRLPIPTVSLGELIRHHCGVIDPDHPTDIIVRLLNDTSEPRKVLQSEVSCGCLKLVHVPTVIGAGESADCRLTWNAQQTSGIKTQKLLIATDNPDPRRTLFQVEVVASVKSPWCSPKEIEFGRVSLANKQVRVATSSVLGYQQVRFDRISSNNPNFTGQFVGAPKQTIHEGGMKSGDVQYDQQVEINLSEHAAAGRHFGHLQIEFSGDGTRLTTQIPVFVEITGLARCVPPSVVWSNATRGEPLQAEVEITSVPAYPLDLKLLKVTSDAQELIVKQVRQSDTQVKLQISFVPNVNDKQKIIETVIKGIIEDREVFKIPVLAVLRPPAPNASSATP